MKVILLLCLVAAVAFAAVPRRTKDIPRPRIIETKLYIDEPRSADEGKIIGGSDATPGEFPWQVSMQVVPTDGSSRYHICGATIVDELHIVCASHCIIGQTLATTEIVVGAHNITDTEEATQQRLKVKRMIPHPDYNAQLVNHDISLIVLSSPIDMTKPGVAGLKLAPENYVSSGRCMNTGWGNANPTGDEPVILPDVLQKVELHIVGNIECARYYIGTAFIGETHLCAGDGVGKGSCNGDSGGPLVCKDETDEWYLAGVVSFGMQPCGQAAFPTVFANVSTLRPFLDLEITRP